MDKKKPASIETTLYITGWCLIGLFLMISLFLSITGFPIRNYLLPCIFHSVTGYYCPGCGGTRSSFYLLHGHFIRSFLYHPFVIYVAVLGLWFMLSQSIERISRHRIRIGMKYRDIYLWIAIVIVAVNFIVKNLFLLVWGIDLLTF